MAKIAVYRFFWRHQETGEIVDEDEIDEKGFLKNSKR
jgi:hypothetical protein